MTTSTVLIDMRKTRRQSAALAKLANPSQQQLIINRLVEKVAVTGQSLVSDPPVPTRAPLPERYERTAVDGSTYLSKFKTEKQQKFFFGVVVKKGFTPYKRGRGLSEQLTAQLGLLPYRIERNSQKYTIIWGVDASYAELVVGDESEQAEYHKGVWTPLVDDIASDKAIATYQQVFTSGLQDAVDSLSKGSSAFTG